MGPKMRVRGAGEIAKLTGPEPEEVFEAIRGWILQDDNFAAKLKGTDGLVRLVEARRSCSIRHLHLGRRTSDNDRFGRGRATAKSKTQKTVASRMK